VSGNLGGTVAENQVRFRSSQKIEGTRLTYDFRGTATGESMSGTATGESMSGTVNMGEYGDAR